jgi:hypothetical protein
VRWFQLWCVPGRFATAEPKMMRWGFWHTPARLIRHARRNIVRIIDGWPTTTEILTAYQRIALLS